MKKLMFLGTGAAVAAAAASAALFGAGVATADDYAGQTYADASAAASDAGDTVVIAARVGSTLPEDECIVTRSHTAPFTSGLDGAHVDGTVQFYLNCAGAYASTKPGASVASPAGREAKAAAEEAAAAEEQELLQAEEDASKG